VCDIGCRLASDPCSFLLVDDPIQCMCCVGRISIACTDMAIMSKEPPTHRHRHFEPLKPMAIRSSSSLVTSKRLDALKSKLPVVFKEVTDLGHILGGSVRGPAGFESRHERWRWGHGPEPEAVGCDTADGARARTRRARMQNNTHTLDSAPIVERDIATIGYASAPTAPGCLDRGVSRFGLIHRPPGAFFAADLPLAGGEFHSESYRPTGRFGRPPGERGVKPLRRLPAPRPINGGSLSRRVGG